GCRDREDRHHPTATALAHPRQRRLQRQKRSGQIDLQFSAPNLGVELRRSSEPIGHAGVGDYHTNRPQLRLSPPMRLPSRRGVPHIKRQRQSLPAGLPNRGNGLVGTAKVTSRDLPPSGRQLNTSRPPNPTSGPRDQRARIPSYLLVGGDTCALVLAAAAHHPAVPFPCHSGIRTSSRRVIGPRPLQAVTAPVLIRDIGRILVP